MSGKRRKFNHEWHLYSIAVVILISAFFFYTAFDVFWATVGSGLVVAMSGLMASSDNWEILVPPEAHKNIIQVFVVGGLLWALHLLWVNRILPYFSRKGITIWPKQN